MKGVPSTEAPQTPGKGKKKASPKKSVAAKSDGGAGAKIKKGTPTKPAAAEPKAVPFANGAPEPAPNAPAFAHGFRAATGQPLSSSSSRAHTEVCPSAISYFESRRNHGRPAQAAPSKRPGKHVSQRMGDSKLARLGLRSASSAAAAGTGGARGGGDADEENGDDAESEGSEGDARPPQPPKPTKRRGLQPVLFYPAKDEKLLPAPKNPQHDAYVKRLFAQHTQRFGEWQSLLLLGGFNVLLHGFGSKHALLRAFVEQSLHRTLVVEARGWEATTSAVTVREGEGKGGARKI